jgi:acetyltransferase
MMSKYPETKVSGMTVEKMHRSTNGRELFIGIVQDAVFGPVISFGSGGTNVELMADTAIALPPLNRSLALHLIDRTRISRALGEFRHLPAVDKEILVDILLRVSTLACELPMVQELDINPLIIDDTGAVAVDARIRMDYPSPSIDPYHHLAIHPYPAHLATSVQLADGTDIIIRPIRPEDAEIEQAFIRKLSSEAKRFRFMSALHELSQEMLVRFTQIDYHNEMALIAVVPHGKDEEEIGVVRYVTNIDRESCEFALVVADTWQRKGIAHYLMDNLIKVARERGLKRMEGEILSDNYKMLDLVHSLGFHVVSNPQDMTIMQASLELQKLY